MRSTRTRTYPHYRLLQKASKLAIHLVLILVALTLILPFLLIISASLTDNDTLVVYGYHLIPLKFSLYAYQFLFHYPEVILKAYGVTIFVTTIGTSVGLLFTAMLGYAISRLTGRPKKILSFFVLFTILFGAGLVPYYLVMTRYYHLKDSLFALIIPGLVSSFNVMLLRSYFSQLPKEILDAAKIDGANEIQVFFQIALPLSTPALATFGLFTFLGYWNDYFQSLLFITKPSLYPLQFLLYNILGNAQAAYNQQALVATSIQPPLASLRMAMVIIAAGPAVLVSLTLGRFFIRGITLGGINK